MRDWSDARIRAYCVVKGWTVETIKKPETTHRAEQELGPSVVGGRLVWTSASHLTKADPNSAGGCLRRWFYETVLGLRSASTKAQETGTKLHSEVDGYLTQGRPLVSQLAIAGRAYIDAPGPGILIETAIHTAKDGALTGAWLYCGPTPIAGHVDLWNHRGFHINAEAELVADKPSTLETKDWKTTSDFKWCKTPTELASNIQLITYAEVGFRMWPQYDLARMTHVYFRTKGRPESQLVSVLCDREHVSRQWEYVSSIGRTIADAARETAADAVDANRNACSAYGGCPHRSYCTVGNHDSLADILGPRGAAEAVARLNQARGEQVDMSLINKLAPGALAPQAAQQPAPVMAPPAAGVAMQMQVDAEVAALQAQETARRQQTAAGIPAGFQEAVMYLSACGRGYPTITGRAANAIAVVTGSPNTGTIPGAGWLATKVPNGIEDPEILIRLVNEVRTLPALTSEPTVIATPPLAPTPPPSMLNQAPAPVAQMVPVAPPVQQPSLMQQPVTQIAPSLMVLPPDAPASNPALAAQPVEGLDNSKARELAAIQAAAQQTQVAGLAATAAIVQQTGALPTPAVVEAANTGTFSLLGTTQPTPAPVMATAPAAVAAAIATVAAATPETLLAAANITTEAPAAGKRKGPGRPPGSRKKRTVSETAQVGDVSNTVTTTEEDDDSLSIFVNTMPSLAFEDIRPYVDQLCASLCATYGAADIRCAPKEGPLSFGKWQGALAAFARQNPPPAGIYLARVCGPQDPVAVVADALRGRAIESGGLYAEGFQPV